MAICSVGSITVSPATVNFTIRQGSTLRRTLVWYSEAVYLDSAKTQIDPDNSTPVDLSGHTGRMQVRDRRTNTLVFELTTENGGLSFDAATGAITFYLSDTATDAAQYSKCKYDLEIVNIVGDVIPLVAGSFTITNQVTT